jgi:hypothetical protein
VFEKLFRYRTCAFAEHIGEDVVNLDIGDSQAILGSIFLPSSKAGQLCIVSGKISELPDIKGRNKTWRHKIVFEYVGNPASVFFIGLLAADRFDVFGVREDNVTGSFEHIKYGNPIFTSRFHADITTIVVGKPLGQSAQIAGKRGKASGFVGSDTFVVSRRNTSNEEAFVDVYSTAAREDNFQSQVTTSCKKWTQTLTGRLASKTSCVFAKISLRALLTFICA